MCFEMPKRNITYIKPQEPSFLTKLKRDAGYVEGPTVDTKREALTYDSGSDNEQDNESPVVVVVTPGDLTAEEVAKHNKDKELEEANKKADLSERIIFKKRASKREGEQTETNVKKDVKKLKKNNKKPLLSFDEDEEEDN